MPPKRVGIVPHTHWDREWHVAFETARLRLGSTVEKILSVLENDRAFAHYLLDGQTAPVDDVSELNPEIGERLAILVRSGRIEVGPWAVLPDEFLVSGETLIRNLQAGLRRAEELGAAKAVGYLPDSFGHCAQMPQLLSEAGIEHAVLWRGVPSAVRHDRFRWQALDGSEVVAEHLYGSYANGRDLPGEPDGLVARARTYEKELGDRGGSALLLMNGGDQRSIEVGVPATVEAANRAQHRYRFEITTLAEHVRRRDDAIVDAWQGELRSAAFANLLPSVVSNRVDMRQAAAAAERAVETRAEPLSALFGSQAYPHRELRRAWHLLILNSAHDSVCGCVADEVGDEVLVRYRRARQIGEELSDQALGHLAARAGAGCGSVVVANLTGHDRTGLVGHVCEQGTPPLRGPDDIPLATQPVGEETPTPFQAVVPGTKVGWVLDLLDEHGFQGRPLADARFEQLADGTWSAVLREASVNDDAIDASAVRNKLAGLGDLDAVIRVRADRAPRERVLVECGNVPAFGWTTLTPKPSGAVERAPRTTEHPVTATDTELSNGLLTVRVEPAGTWSIETAEGLALNGLGRLVDGGDGGDTYSWSPPDRDQIVDGSVLVEHRATEHGPLRARVELRSALTLPVAVVGDEVAAVCRADETRRVEVATTLELRAGEDILRISTEVENLVRDHRLRAHFPLPAPVEHSSAGCAFGVVERPLQAEGGPQEIGIATYPARGFVDASNGEAGFAVLTHASTEYEVIDGKELAITLLRATGYLSRVAPANRPNPAGPAVPLVRSQMQGRIRWDFALLLHRGDWREAQLARRAAEYARPLEAFVVRRDQEPAPGISTPTGSALGVKGAEVSSVTRDDDHLIVRVVRVDREPGVVTVEHNGTSARGERIDLAGAHRRDFEGSIELGAFEIATLRILTPTST